MSIECIFLIGAGGHGMVVLDALMLTEKTFESIRVLDESVERIGQRFLELVVNRLDSNVNMAGAPFHVSIGNNSIRAKLTDELRRRGARLRTVTHPAATIAKSSIIRAGAFVAAHAIVAPAASVGEGTIINHGTIVDHECVVGDFCHLAPGVTLAGNVRVGARVLVGAGANILPGITIGDCAIVGAGAVITADVPKGTTYVGVPARQVR
jgi:sugar O-acyltransferase (sialic acid O-acetyltransferase NeuD family)